MTESLAQAVLAECREGMRQLKAQADGAITQATDDDLFATLDPEANSIAILMRHCAGNMRSRWRDFLTTDGEKPDRQREGEFEPPPVRTRAAVLADWESGWSTLYAALDALRAEDLMQDVVIRGERLSAVAAIGRSTRHYAMHVGQIVLLAKHLRGAAWTSLSIPRGQSHLFLGPRRA